MTRISDGFRPVVPITRGASPAIPDKPVWIPPVPFSQEIDVTTSIQPPDAADHVDTDSNASERESVVDPDEQDAQHSTPVVADFADCVFLLNTVSLVAHFACECEQSDPHTFCTFEWQGKMKSFKYACSARRTVGEVSITPSESIPASYRICLRAACSKIFD